MNDYEWVEPYIQRVIEFLGLHAWTWSVSHQTGLYGGHGAHEFKTDATCDANWSYLDATICIDSQVWINKMAQSSTAAKLLLCHEVCHILMAQLAHGMETIVNVYFPPDDQAPSDKSAAMTIYSKHEEHVVTRFARQVYEALEYEEESQKTRKSLDEVRFLIESLDPQLERIADDEGTITGYRMNTGIWHRLLGIARDGGDDA